MILNYTKHFMLFCGLLALVLFVNSQVLSFNMMYPEQTTIYLANQTVSNLSDLAQIYLHPKWLHSNISFFRPSGHFLIYQLITPFTGWQNMQAFFVINFMFLAGIGFIVIKLYPRLFPGYSVGAYIAFSIFLMHPSLNLARLTIMHFDFAYMFFLMLALYLFVMFSERNVSETRVSFQPLNVLLPALFFYVTACTFKEPALMLAPVMACYFALHHKRYVPMTAVLAVICLLMTWYLISAWPSLGQTPRTLKLHDTLGTANAFLKDVIGVTTNYIPIGMVPFPHSGWRMQSFPTAARIVMFTGCWLALIMSIVVFTRRNTATLPLKKSLLFVYAAAVLFMILPLAWGIGGPWHHALTLLFFSIAMGFCLEYLLSLCLANTQQVKWICLPAAFVIALIAFPVNQANIAKFLSQEGGALGFNLTRNAVTFPPDIKQQLTPDSMIVVEDSILHNDYFLGNSAYPFILFFDEKDYDRIQARQNRFFMSFDPTYGGALFRFAYGMPSLHEQLFPFQVEQMDNVFNEVIYGWLKHANNLFCLGYDKQGNWLDKTALFKQQLKRIQAERQIKVKTYRLSSAAEKSKPVYLTKVLTVPNIELCEYTCDQDSQCQGFYYSDRQCQFYRGNA